MTFDRTAETRTASHVRARVAMSADSIEPEPAQRESTISVLVLRALVDAVARTGIAPATFLAAAQLRPEQLVAADARVSTSTLFGACELALDLTGDPAFGLHWAESLSQGTFAPVSHLVAHSASLRQGLDSLAQFYRLLCDDTHHQVVELENEVTLRCLRGHDESARFERFKSEMMVAGFFRLIRQVSVHAQIERVSFAYPAPAYSAEYSRIFGDDVAFEQPFTGVVCARALLDVPGPLKDADMHAALSTLAERRLSRIADHTPYAQRVRELLVLQRSPGRADMTTIARSLGLSVRSLRRRLADEAQTYNAIAGEALTVVAKQFLRDDRYTIQEASYELGFSDTSTFHRAFKRWTGSTPNAYRQAHREHRERSIDD